MEQTKKIINCQCGIATVYRLETMHSNGTVHIELQCQGCKKFLGYAPKVSVVADVNPEALSAEVISFGKHKGTPFLELAKNYPEYCVWMIEKAKINHSLKTKIHAALEFTKAN